MSWRVCGNDNTDTPADAPAAKPEEPSMKPEQASDPQGGATPQGETPTPKDTPPAEGELLFAYIP